MIERYLQHGQGILSIGRWAGYAWDSRWALRLISFLLFFDTVMLLHLGRGILQWNDGDKNIFNNLVWIAANFGVFSLVIAVVLPFMLSVYYVVIAIILALSMLTRWWLTILLLAPVFIYHVLAHVSSVHHAIIVGIVYLCIVKVIFEGRETAAMPDGFIRLPDLHNKAIARKDEFLLRLYEIKKRQLTDDTRNRFNIVLLIASLVVMATTNWLVSADIPNGIGLVDEVMLFMAFTGNAPKGELSDILWLDAILLFIIACGLWNLVDPNRSDFVHVPVFDQDTPQ